MCSGPVPTAQTSSGWRSYFCFSIFLTSSPCRSKRVHARFKNKQKNPARCPGRLFPFVKTQKKLFPGCDTGTLLFFGDNLGRWAGRCCPPRGSLIPPGALCLSLYLQKHNFKFLIPVHHLWRGKLTSGMLVLLFHSTLSYKKCEYWSGDVFINCFVFFFWSTQNFIFLA